MGICLPRCSFPSILLSLSPCIDLSHTASQIPRCKSRFGPYSNDSHYTRRDKADNLSNHLSARNHQRSGYRSRPAQRNWSIGGYCQSRYPERRGYSPQGHSTVASYFGFTQKHRDSGGRIRWHPAPAFLLELPGGSTWDRASSSCLFLVKCRHCRRESKNQGTAPNRYYCTAGTLLGTLRTLCSTELGTSGIWGHFESTTACPLPSYSSLSACRCYCRSTCTDFRKKREDFSWSNEYQGDKSSKNSLGYRKCMSGRNKSSSQRDSSDNCDWGCRSTWW